MLQVDGLTRLALGPFDFEVADGACLAFTGPSGAGKSLLLRAIADLDVNEGRVKTGALDRAAVSGPEWRRAVALLPAESGWWGAEVAEHFVDAGAIGDLLEQVGLDREAINWQVARLSTGERHRLALVRALEQGPEVLLLDEPTTMLDAAATTLVEDLLRARMAQGLSIVMVTHDAEQPGRIADQVMRLEGGRLKSAGVDA